MNVNGDARSNLCEINVRLIRTTDRAALVVTAFRESAPAWVPLSQVELHANEDAAGSYCLVLPEWLAIDKGLV